MTLTYGADGTSKELADGLREYFAEQYDTDQVRSAWTDIRFDDSLWKEMASLGMNGVLADEGSGGLGIRPSEAVLAIEEIGYSGASLPLMDTSAVIIPILERYGTRTQQDELLPGLVSGDIASSSTVMVGGDRAMFADDVDLLLFEGAEGLHLLRRGEFGVEEVHSPDPAIRLGRVVVDSDVLAATPRFGAAALAEARIHAVWASAALLNGVSRRMLDMTVEHAKTREQFGRPIGTFQAVKHLIADAWVGVESSRPCAWYAAYASSGDPTVAKAAASVAKAAASDAARRTGDMALQVHGGIGFTWEHPLHFWMKRGKFLEDAYGSLEFHLRRLGSVVRNHGEWSQIIFAEADSVQANSREESREAC